MPRRVRLLLAGAASLFAAAPLAAQVMRFPTRQYPSVWISASAGFLQIGDVFDDDAAGAEWNLDDAVQWRGSIERDRGTGTSFGLVATYARPGVLYSRAVNGRVAERERTRATVSSLSAVLRAGEGAGLHQVVELSVGARRYTGFSADPGDGTATVSVGTATDLTGSLGVGFGYSLGQRAAITVVQDADFTYHRDAGDASQPLRLDKGVHRSYVTRLGLRFGFGDRGRLR